MKQLETIVDADRILASAEQTAPYVYHVAEKDTWIPDAVLFPETNQQIAKILKSAGDSGTAIIPEGAGSRRHLVSPCLRGLVLSTSRMDRILDIDRGNMTATVESGVPIGALQGALEKEGLFFPPYPYAFEHSTTGGSAAVSAGGAAINKYGVFKQYVMGMEVTIPNGEVMTIGSQTMKNVVGYDLVGLFCGSEGTLGIIGKLILRLLPRPPWTRLVLAGFNAYTAAVDALQSLAVSPSPPAAATVLHRRLMQPMASGSSGNIFTHDAVVMIQVEGIEERAEKELKDSLQIMDQRGATDIRIIEESAEIKRCWHAQSRALSHLAGTVSSLITADIAVPLEQAAGLIDTCEQAAKRFRVDLTFAGYHGRGLIHPVFWTGQADVEFLSKAQKAWSYIRRQTLKAGGTISGPFRTIGIEKAKFNLSGEEQTMKLAQGVKKVLDPDDIMKPGFFNGSSETKKR